MRRVGVLVVTVAVLAGGCDGGDGGAAPRQSTTTTASAETHASVLDLVDAADSAAKQRRAATFQLSGSRLRRPLGTGRLTYRERGLAMAMRTVRNGQYIEFRVIGERLFLKATGPLAGAAGGRTWLATASAARIPAARVVRPVIGMAARYADPARTFDVFLAAGDIAASERTMLGRAAVTRYDIDLDVMRLADHIEHTTPGQQRPPLAEALRAAAAQGMTTVPAQVWLDHDNLPRRFMLADVTALLRDGAGRGRLPEITVTFRDWGRADPIKPPPARRISAAGMPR